MISDMPPSPSPNNGLFLRNADSKSFCNCFMRVRFFCRQLPYLDNLRDNQPRSSLFFSPRRPPTVNHIPRVFCPRSRLKVGWVYARWIITIMLYLHSLWNQTIHQLPRKAVRLVYTATGIVCGYYSIPVFIFSASPNPASIWIGRPFHIQLKSNNKGSTFGGGHDDPPSRFAVSRAVVVHQHPNGSPILRQRGG